MKPDASRLPWNLAVPVKRSGFTPLRTCDAELNVEVDLGRIGAFSNRTVPLPASELLFADLQLSPDVNINRRLGSGRAGVFADRYLKGVGRTLLAGNWNDGDDLYHSSGLLLASAGAREYLVSEYVAGLGLTDAIVPCEGLLVRRLPEDFADHLRRLFGARNVNHASFDNRLQMISHKPAGFARYSNFVWWLCAFPQELETRSAFASLFHLFYRSLAPSVEQVGSPNADEIAERFARSVLRGIDNFIAAWRAGITWGSISNNFTADGRFLDLETPNVLAGPWLGAQLNSLDHDGPLPERVRASPRGHFFGLEVVRYLGQVRRFAAWLDSRLRLLARSAVAAPTEARFIAEFLARLTWHLHQTCPVLRPRVLSRLIADKLTATIEPTRAQGQLLRCMVCHALEGPDFLARERGPAGFAAYKAASFVRVELDDMSPIEPGFRLELYVPEFLRDRPRPQREAAQVFHDALRTLEQSRDVDDCLATLAAKAPEVRRAAASARAGHGEGDQR